MRLVEIGCLDDPELAQRIHDAIPTLIARLTQGQVPRGGWNDRIFPRTESYSSSMAVLALIAKDLPPVAEWKT